MLNPLGISECEPQSPYICVTSFRPSKQRMVSESIRETDFLQRFSNVSFSAESGGGAELQREASHW